MNYHWNIITPAIMMIGVVIGYRITTSIWDYFAARKKNLPTKPE